MLLRAGLSMRSALEEWPRRAPAQLRGDLDDLVRRVRLGQRPSDAVARTDGLECHGGLAAIVELHLEMGCDAAALVDALARALERSARLAREARASVAGPKTSGMLVAALPLAFVPLLSGGGWRLDRVGSLLTVAGVGLLLAGMSWIARLMPVPPGPDWTADLAELVAAGLGAGASVPRAFEICARALRDPHAHLAACYRRVRLGAPWAVALERSSDGGLVALAAVVRRSEELGVPIAEALAAFAEERRALAESAFVAASRRAPVWMVLPLVLCILPSFALLALAPFLRGLSSGS